MDVTEVTNATAVSGMGAGTQANVTASDVAAARQAKQAGGVAPAKDVHASAASAATRAYQIDVKADGAAQEKAIKGLTKEQAKILQAGIDSGYQKMLESMAKGTTNANLLVQGSLSANGGSKVNAAYQLMIDVLSSHNKQLQRYVDDGVGTLNFGGTKIGADKFVLPSVGTTPEEAAKAIADGGQWSVHAVSDRLFGMATALAGNDAAKLKAMQGAIEAGFKQAGITWKDATGEDKMPKITQDTHAAITKRLEAALAKLGQKAAGSAGAADAATGTAAAAH